MAAESTVAVFAKAYDVEEWYRYCNQFRCTIVQFSMDVCTPCKAIFPVFVNHANKIRGQGAKTIGFAKIEVCGKHPSKSDKFLIDQYNIEGYPTFFAVNSNGIVIGEWKDEKDRFEDRCADLGVWMNSMVQKVR